MPAQSKASQLMDGLWLFSNISPRIKVRLLILPTRPVQGMDPAHSHTVFCASNTPSVSLAPHFCTCLFLFGKLFCGCHSSSLGPGPTPALGVQLLHSLPSSPYWEAPLSARSPPVSVSSVTTRSQLMGMSPGSAKCPAHGRYSGQIRVRG